eukprot:CAMPEP_0181226230 /NCGR_PEP_ID=MMETSP1096-20121128/32145_1 /TAXON_ID=156174 ORGANISM="Chrysochromulina ericina, Strain CCMP281" /NCGR_SAMPLE_ID=MMETSP1096 /ASSEMBLY_ACC=CAM_ASM_000453 /LENGTH=119 /DNA_ID=CAMNT_0023319557 /DNA_START=112 /DNA_END=472 /DNA_ORIENTATION=-
MKGKWPQLAASASQRLWGGARPLDTAGWVHKCWRSSAPWPQAKQRVVTAEDAAEVALSGLPPHQLPQTCVALFEDPLHTGGVPLERLIGAPQVREVVCHMHVVLAFDELRRMPHCKRGS